jgi:hypothetical protein
VKQIFDDVREFIHEECFPKEKLFMEHQEGPTKWEVWPEIEFLKGIWLQK